MARVRRPAQVREIDGPKVWAVLFGEKCQSREREGQMMGMVQERSCAPHVLMKEQGMDAYLVLTADSHESGYVGERFRRKKYITGFTGLARTATVTMDETCLWVDGRYFVQASHELEGISITTMKVGQEGVPDVEEYLEQTLPSKGYLGLDGRMVNAAARLNLEDVPEDKNVRIFYGLDPAGNIWDHRPELSAKSAWVLAQQYAGKCSEDKTQDVREAMKKAHTSVYVFTSMDGIAWLLNIRGGDIHRNPMVLFYVMVTMEQLCLSVNEEVLEHRAYPYINDGEGITIRQYLEGIGVTVLPYDRLYNTVEDFRNEKVLLEKGRVNYVIYRLLGNSNRIIDKMNPTVLIESVKNDMEIENERNAHIKDGMAVTKFIYWLKKNIGRIPTDEVSISDYLEKLRMEQEGCIGLSFSTTSAYGEHRAMCHYSVIEKINIPLGPKGLYLAGSGDQYYEGTTDIIRTIALGPMTDEEKKRSTLVLMSILRLGAVRFLHGCRGLSIDYVAREPLWSRGLNFEHGTGHGVSYLSSCHERPNRIRFKMVPERQDNGVLGPGMITSDEPGLYIEGSHGIKTENPTVCVKDEKNGYGQFLKFKSLTFTPIDPGVVDKTLATEHDVELLNEYHRQAYERIDPHLNRDGRVWLKDVTAVI